MVKLFAEMIRYWMVNAILSEGWNPRMVFGRTGAMWIPEKTVPMCRMVGHFRPVERVQH